MKAIERSPRVGEAVTNRIRQAILSGELADGDSLPLESVAERLGVSVMPVREALINLANEGLVEDHGRRGGYRVKALSERDLRDVYELHGYLQSMFAGRAATSISDTDIATLREIQDEVTTLAAKRATKQVSTRLQELNNQFHRTINRSVDANVLRVFMRSTLKFLRDDAYEAYPEWVESTLRDHPPIIEALATGNEALAATLMRAHIAEGAPHARRDEVGSPA